MTMGKLKEMKNDENLDSVTGVVITDHKMGKSEKLKNITSCNLGERLDQVQQEQAVAGGEDGGLDGEVNLPVSTELRVMRAGMGIFEKVKKAAASTPSKGNKF